MTTEPTALDVAVEQLAARIKASAIEIRGLDPRTRVSIDLWPDVESFGVRVAEVDFWLSRPENERLGDGSSFMQSDIPNGLVVCAQVERVLIEMLQTDITIEVDELYEVLTYALFGAQDAPQKEEVTLTVQATNEDLFVYETHVGVPLSQVGQVAQRTLAQFPNDTVVLFSEQL